MPRTTFVWVCREESAVEALQGLVKTLENHGGLRHATVKILPVSETRPVQVGAEFGGPDGRPFGPGVLNVDNCPAGGILLLEDEEDDD